MKICSTCKIEKHFAEFRKDASTNDGYQYRCKCCAKRRQSDRYKEVYHVAAKVNSKRRRQRRHQLLTEFVIRNGGCIVCGELDPNCIDFHHLDPSTKDFGIAASGGISWELVEKEIAKCVMLCGNHHRQVHWDNFDLTPYLKINGGLAERPIATDLKSVG